MQQKQEKTLTIICPGTGMRWEDMAIVLGLNINERHNIKGENGKYPDDMYFCLDGPAVVQSETNPPIASSSSTIKFDPEAKELISGKMVEQSPMNQALGFVSGEGMENNVEIAHALVAHIKSKLDSEPGSESVKIKLVGFSRGGPTANMIANVLNEDKKTANIPVDIFNIDPVAGLSRNDQKNIEVVARNVKNYITVLAAMETLFGFNPRDFVNTRFQSEKTNRLFLPVPDDHVMAAMWAQGLVKSFLSSGSKTDIFYSNPIAEGELKNNYETKYGTPRGSSTVAFMKDSDKYLRSLSSAKEDEKSIETYYQHASTRTSLQGDADPDAKRAQELSSYFAMRSVTKNIRRYQNHPFFCNIHHEAQFATVYPNIYQWITGQETITLKDFKEEYKKMPKFTKEYFAEKLGIKNIDDMDEKRFIAMNTKLKREFKVSPLNYRSNLYEHKHILQLLNEGKVDLECGSVIQQTVKLLHYTQAKFSKAYAVTRSNESYATAAQLQQLAEAVAGCKDEDAAIKILKNFKSPTDSLIRIVDESILLLSNQDNLKEHMIHAHVGKVVELTLQVKRLEAKLGEKLMRLGESPAQEKKRVLINEKIKQLHEDLRKINGYIEKLPDDKVKLYDMDYVDLGILLKEQEAEFGWEVSNTLRLNSEEKFVADKPNKLFSLFSTDTKNVFEKAMKSFSEERLPSTLQVNSRSKSQLIDSHREKISELKSLITVAIENLREKADRLGEVGQEEKIKIIERKIEQLVEHRSDLAMYEEKLDRHEHKVDLHHLDYADLKNSLQKEEANFRSEIKESLQLDNEQKKIVDRFQKRGEVRDVFRGSGGLFSFFSSTGTAKALKEAEKSLSEGVAPPPSVKPGK